jgi:predicted nucleic acid-binding protein
MKQAYIDSCVWITAIEGLSDYQERIDQALRQLTEQGWKFCTSDVVLFELLLKPMKTGQADLIKRYYLLFEKMKHLSSYPNLFTEALHIAHLENLKGMDAVHLAIAAHHHCMLFVSTDPHLRSLVTITPCWINLGNITRLASQPVENI